MIENDNIKNVLSFINSLSQKYENIYKETGSEYNIFKISGKMNNEVIICQIIADLLNPIGKHYHGTVFLQQFIDIVLKDTVYNSLNVNRTWVHREHLTDENRRIDIVLRDDKLSIPIEVKIYAGDQDDQILHYYEFMNEEYNDKKIPVLYLTLDGHKPSSDSVSEDIHYHRISFKKEIIPWLYKCIEIVTEISSIFEILRQLVIALEYICGMENKPMEREVIDFIVSSQQNYQSTQYLRTFKPYDLVKEVFSNDFIKELQSALGDKLKISYKEKDSDYPESLHITSDNFWVYLSYDHNTNFSIYKKNGKSNLTEEIEKILGFKPSGNPEWKSWGGGDCIWHSSNFTFNFLNNVIDDWCKKDGLIIQTDPFVLYRIYTKYRNIVVDKIKEIVNLILD